MHLWMVGFLYVGCSNPTPVDAPATIEEVSQEITFDSLARMGSHHGTSSMHREIYRDGEVSRTSTTSIEITWNSWESFHFQRFTDGTLTFETIVHGGASAARDGRGPWKGEFDGERSRMDIYTAWNAWDEALGGFRDRIIFTDQGPTVVDGRPARRFSVSLAPPEDRVRKNRRNNRMQPHRLEGEVILDKATAVRLRADVLGVEKRGSMVRRTTLSVSRTNLGEVQPIEAPEVQLGTAGDLLKKLPDRPTPQ